MSATDAIIVSFRESVKATLKDLLKRKKVANIVCSESIDEAVNDLLRFPKGLLIVDWDVGHLDVAKVLTANLGDTGVNVRQVVVLADEITTPLVTTSVEFGVNQIAHDISNRGDLESKIGNLIRSASQRNELRSELQQVAKHRKVGQYAEGEKILRGLLIKNPNHLAIMADLADCLLAQGRAKEAKAILEPIPDSQPPNLRYFHVYGRCLMQMGEFEKAKEVLQRANVYNPFHAERLVDLGQVLLQGEDFKEAAQAFDQALLVAPGSKDAARGKGQAMMLDGAVNEALEILQGSVDEVEIAAVFNLSAVFCIRNDRFEQGMSLYRTAVRALGSRDKLLAKLYFNMGIGYFRQNDFGAARRQFELACQHDASFNKARNNLRVVEQKLLHQSSSPAGLSMVVPAVSNAALPVKEELSKPDTVKIDNEFDDFEGGDLTDGLEDSLGW